MGEVQTAPGRLRIGTDVQVRVYSTTAGGITSYYIDVAGPKPTAFTAVITAVLSTGQPRYSVSSITSEVQAAELLASELAALSNVINIGEPSNYNGNMSIGQQVEVKWNENADGTYTPYMEQQLNIFLPPS
jgi:hypothetical protein